MNRVHFYALRKKEVDRVIWIYANSTFVTRWSSSTIWPEFSNSLEQKLKKGNLNERTRKLLFKEFDKKYSENINIYKIALLKIEKQWRKIEKKIFQEISKISQLNIQNNYMCYLTLYGGEGGGSEDNKIYIRADTENDPNDIGLANYTIAHELIYLMTKFPSQEQCLSSLYSQALKEKFVQSIIERPAIKKLLK